MKRLQKKTHQELKRLIEKYVVLLNLTGWEIDIIVSDKNLLRTQGRKVKQIKNVDYYAETIYDYLKKSASIILTKLQAEKPEELEDTIFHEMLHIKLSSLTQLSESLVNIADLSKEQTEQLLCEIDTNEHEIVNTIVKLFLKQGKNNGK